MVFVFVQTEAVKDMEAKLEEHEQNKLYLDQLLAMLKDRDPTLLHVINTSLASRYSLSKRRKTLRKNQWEFSVNMSKVLEARENASD